MSKQSSSSEVQAEFNSSFPSGIGDLGFRLWNDISHLHLNWSNYKILFGTTPDRIDLLNKTSSSFFLMIERVLRQDIVMKIARLTDPASSGRSKTQKNASLLLLLEELEPYLEKSLIGSLNLSLKELLGLSKPIRKLRNKRFAHSDLIVALSFHSDPLPGISRSHFEDVLSRIRTVFNLIEEQFRGSTTYFEHVISSNNADALVYHLQNSVDINKKRHSSRIL